MYYIDKFFLGSPAHLKVTDASTTYVDNLPDGCVTDNGTTHPGTLGAFLQITGKKYNLIPENLLNSLTRSNIPISQAGLSYIVRESELAVLLAEHKHCVIPVLEKFKNYVPRYVENIKTLNSCLAIKFASTPDGVEIDDQGFSTPVMYDTSLTKTGRMKVISGPSVLTMKKEFKSKICSRHADGIIVEIDFSALEPRTALAISEQGNIPQGDFYDSIGARLGIDDRGTAKQVIISFLYGAGLATTCRLANIEESVLLPKLNSLKKMFSYDTVVQSLLASFQKNGYFLNHAGRPVFPTTQKPGTLFNNFTQSSAVDVAMSGFTNLLSRISADKIAAVPVCFIHDALLLDVKRSDIEHLRAASNLLPTYLGIDFPTKLKITG